MRKLIAGLLGVAAVLLVAATPDAQVAAPGDSLRFAAIGDNGTGDLAQYAVADQMARARTSFPFDFVIMLGDNMYGGQSPGDFVIKFERPYAALLGAGVKFIASLGNHDNQTNRNYKGFNMNGERYFTYVRGPVRFYVLDTNFMDPKQLAWLDESLKLSDTPWKIAYFHHPLYSDAGRHGSDVQLRVILEPRFVQGGIDVVLSGHDHAYERFKPQKDITYFVAGSGGQLAKGDIKRSAQTAAAFDQDNAFMLIEVKGNDLSFRTISRIGQEVDRGVIHPRPKS